MTPRTKTRGKSRNESVEQPAAALPVRLAVGLGDPERERALLSALDTYPDVIVVERCLSADQLVATVHDGLVDAVLAAFGLHRLTDARLQALGRTRVPTVLLAPDDAVDLSASFPGIVLRPDADASLVHEAVVAAMRGEHLTVQAQRPMNEAEPNERPASEVLPETALSVVVITGGPGSGRTTVALNLATALGVVAPTVLVDLDLHAPGVAACLDADPTRNLAMVAHAEPETPRDWDRAIQQEVQPLHPRSPQSAVLCGLPKPEMRSAISPRFVDRLIAELTRQYRYVLLDTGADFLGQEAAVYGTALAAAKQTLVVCSADLVGLWRTRTILQLLHQHLQLDPAHVGLILNRYDPRYHHGRSEIEWALEVPVAAVIPQDHRAAERALADQRPLVLNGKSRAAKAFLDLAARVHGGKILLPPEEMPSRGRRRWASWLRWPKTAPAAGKQ